jgi:hypothetical protein
MIQPIRPEVLGRLQERAFRSFWRWRAQRSISIRADTSSRSPFPAPAVWYGGMYAAHQHIRVPPCRWRRRALKWYLIVAMRRNSRRWASRAARSGRKRLRHGRQGSPALTGEDADSVCGRPANSGSCVARAYETVVGPIRALDLWPFTNGLHYERHPATLYLSQPSENLAALRKLGRCVSKKKLAGWPPRFA